MILSTQTSNVVGSFGVEDGIKLLKEAGYDALDLSLFPMSTTPQHPLYGDGWREYVEGMKRTADEVGIPFNQSHVPFVFNWKNPNEFEERFMPLNIRGLEATAIAGAKIAIVHPWHYSQFMGHEEEIFEKNMEFFRSLLPYAKEFGVKIALENMWQKEPKRGYIYPSACGTAKEFARYIDTLDSEYFVACLDLGHCGLVGEEAQDAIRILGHDRLKALHVHDNNYKEDTHTLPGLMMMNWDEITRALADIDYDGEFTYEADTFLKNFDNAFKPEAVRFMVKRGRDLIAKIEAHKQNS